MKLIIN